jgi:hypothetical protein
MPFPRGKKHVALPNAQLKTAPADPNPAAS